MLKRPFLALIVAATCWSLSSTGNAQGFSAPGRRAPMNSGQGPYSGASNVAIPVAVPVEASSGGIPVASPVAAATTVADPNRKLQPGDQLLLKIEQDREAPIAVAVSGTGEITVDPLPPTIKIGGLTVSQATTEIRRVLEKDYYYTATVRLTLEKASNPKVGSVSLSGKVNRVGSIPFFADHPMTVSESILAASGFAPYANERTVKVTRVTNGTPQFFIVDVKSILKEGKVERDMVLHDGDKIWVDDNFFKPN